MMYNDQLIKGSVENVMCGQRVHTISTNPCLLGHVLGTRPYGHTPARHPFDYYKDVTITIIVFSWRGGGKNFLGNVLCEGNE